MNQDSDLSLDIHRVIAFSKAADGLSTSPLAPVLQEAVGHIAQQHGLSVEQLNSMLSEVSSLVSTSLSTSPQQGTDTTNSDTDSTSDSTDSHQVTDENVTLLARIYGAQVGWQQRMGVMPELSAAKPSKMAAFVDVHRDIDDDDEALSQRAQDIYEQLDAQGITPDADFAQSLREQIEQYSNGAIAPVDKNDAVEQGNSLVARAADAALETLYQLGTNRYDGESVVIEWHPESRELSIDGAISMKAQQQKEGRWVDAGSPHLDDAFIRTMEDYVNPASTRKEQTR